MNLLQSHALPKNLTIFTYKEPINSSLNPEQLKIGVKSFYEFMIQLSMIHFKASSRSKFLTTDFDLMNSQEHIIYIWLCQSKTTNLFYRVVEWLDEYHPGSFRQAQVSFSTRIPNAFPLGDAMTMSTNICLYNAYGCHHNYRDVLKPPAANKGPVNGPTTTVNEPEPSTPLPSVIEEDSDLNVNGPVETSPQTSTAKVSSPKHGGWYFKFYLD